MNQRKKLLRYIGRVLAGAMLFNALGPLSVLAQEAGHVNPAAQRQMQQLSALNQRVEQAKAAKAQSPAERVAKDFKQAQDLVQTLKADSDASASNPKSASSDKEQYDTRVVGPDLRVEAKRNLVRLSDAQRAERRSRLKGHLKAIHEGEGNARAEFAAIGKDLKAKKLPAKIMARHNKAVAQFEERAAEFERLSQAWLVTQSDQALTQLDDFFKRYPAQRKAVPFDPQKLPWSTPKPTTRKPASTKAAWFQQLWGDRSVRLAQATNVGPINFLIPPEPSQTPEEADLAETPETQRTQAIIAKAAELGNNPVAIHNWVRNSVEWVPTWGAIQSAEDTLNKKRGNAHDIASLEIALLRAANIPARYQYGTIEVDADKVQNWVGGVSNPQAAQTLLGQGGIANTGLTSGGKIIKIQLEHIWVSAYVNWTPSRGAKQGSSTQHVNPNGPMNGWVSLDPSFKQYSYTEGLDLKTAVPLDAEALLTAAQQGATVNEAEGWVQNLNQTAIQSQLTDYQTALQTYIDSQNADATVGDVIGKKIIPQHSPPMLMGSMQYKLVQSGQQVSEVPEVLRWKLELRLFVSENEKAARNPAISHSFNLSALHGKRLAARPIPASDADRDLLEQYVTGTATSLPSYLIRIKTQITLDEQPLVSAPSQQMGIPQYWGYVLKSPAGSGIEEDFAFESTVGDEIVFGLNAAGTSLSDVEQRFSSVDPNTAIENLNHLALGYWARSDTGDDLSAALSSVVSYRMPSIGLFSQPLTVIYSWGVPRAATYESYSIDIRRLSQIAVQKTTSSVPLEYLVQSGYRNSYLEGRIFEEIFDWASGNGISAASVLEKAVRDGAKMWTLTPANVDAWLQESLLSIEDKNRVADYVALGFIVNVSDEETDFGFWQGTAYIAIDPQTGSGAYLIAGGANGGEFLPCEKKKSPITESVPARVLTVVARYLIRLASIEFAVAGTIAIGASGPAAPVTATIVGAMRAVGIVALVWSTTSYAAGGCKSSEKCHRGSFQAQGSDMPRAPRKRPNQWTLSEPWAQITPLTKAEAYIKLNVLKAQLSAAQLALRAPWFVQMEDLISRAPANGLCAPDGGTFPKPNPFGADGYRLDWVINSGNAFTN